MRKNNFKEYLSWYLLLCIPLLGTMLFNIYPLIQTVTDSFQNVKGEYIGLVNYDIILNDQDFLQAIVNTIYKTALGMLFNVPLAFVIATMLNNIKHGKNFYKIIFLLPLVMSMVTVASLFKYLMMPSEEGVFNYFRSLMGLDILGFLSDPSMARESITAMTVWKGIGYNVILFFAGLQSIPKEMYEAAKIDGANELKQWIYITIPSMKGTFTFVLITATIAGLKRFTDVYAISGETGNPAGALRTIMLYIFNNQFSSTNYKDLGRGSAAAVVLFALILVVTIFNYAITAKNNQDTYAKKTKKKKRGHHV